MFGDDLHQISWWWGRTAGDFGVYSPHDLLVGSKHYLHACLKGCQALSCTFGCTRCLSTSVRAQSPLNVQWVVEERRLIAGDDVHPSCLY